MVLSVFFPKSASFKKSRQPKYQNVNIFSGQLYILLELLLFDPKAEIYSCFDIFFPDSFRTGSALEDIPANKVIRQANRGYVLRTPAVKFVVVNDPDVSETHQFLEQMWNSFKNEFLTSTALHGWVLCLSPLFFFPESLQWVWFCHIFCLFPKWPPPVQQNKPSGVHTKGFISTSPHPKFWEVWGKAWFFSAFES